MAKFIDLTGKRFGRLLIINRADDTNSGLVQWLCSCDCGVKATVRGGDLRSGDSKSCGCLKRELLFIRSFKHGHNTKKHETTSTYITWQMMLSRCHSESSTCFYKYGAKGISVCDRWRGSFESFLADMGARPQGKTIDRINSNGNYEPGNCRWANANQQAANKGKSVRNTSGVKNIRFEKNKWRVRIGFGNKLKHIGMFDSLDLAKLAAAEAREKYHGDFANHV